jgi:hypothetical protein
MLYTTIIDLLTLKCPTCRIPVDPNPDACAAVFCLNCGNEFCHCCFKGFSSNDKDKNKKDAHIHAATHHDSNVPEERNAFLSADIIIRGHRQYRLETLIKCLGIALKSDEFNGKQGSKNYLELALILASQDIEAGILSVEAECSPVFPINILSLSDN